jgi:hypothetical protein
LVEVPKWRHALINIAHPLLKQGLVILDTPGLNAIGAEPELTVSLIPQAHAVVFLLSADTGVTKTDLVIWREHLIKDDDELTTRLVVLNKIDTLWDALSSPAEVDEQIERQRVSSARILSTPRELVIPVSAQKGLVAKVTQDPELLAMSRLPELEEALSQGILGQRQKMLGAAVVDGVSELRTETDRILNIRRRDLTEQMLELKGLQGKNSPLIRNMRSRISQEQSEFELGGAKIHAVRSVHIKLLKEIFATLSPSTLKKEMAQLTAVLHQRGLKLGAKKAYGETFEKLREGLRKVGSINAEIHTMLSVTFRQLNTEYGFSLQVPTEPSVEGCLQAFDVVERSHLQYLSLGNAFRLARPEFAEMLVRALSSRLRTIHESALGDIELWSKSATAQIDAQLRERRRNFSRRLEAIDRIQHASGGLDERIAEISTRGDALQQIEIKLSELTRYLETAIS